ncbi:transposase [Nonomuraea sp. NPDC048916]|uniref:transposase n=1 Tax=Nonomuraea sp. NPDC048916 TaxID=3154232 RepID=UPI0033C43F2F
MAGPARRSSAHVPPELGFATKPRLAERRICRILPGLPDGLVWVTTDEVYGRDGAFRAFLERHGLPYAVAVQANQAAPRPSRFQPMGAVMMLLICSGVRAAS